MRFATTAVLLQNISKTYLEGDARHLVFKDLNLDIRAGECVALLGPSGSGKSTLLNLISGIDLPDTGIVRVGDSTLTQLDESQRTRFRRQQIGFVFQFFNLIPSLTVEENLFLPLELNGLYDTTHRGQALDLLTAVGLGERRTSFPERLSGGERQRLAIARALVHTPTLLLADEPTGNLDTATGERVLELLFNLPRHHGRTLVLVTHSRSISERADRVLRLEAGHLYEPPP